MIDIQPYLSPSEIEPSHLSPLAKKIPDFDRVYTIQLTNSLATSAQVTLFGAYQFLLQTPTNTSLPVTVTATIPASFFNFFTIAIAYNSLSNTMYVTHTGGNDDIDVIDCVTNTVIATISVGINPSGIAYNSISNRMYVTNFGSGTVSVIDCVTNLVIGAPIVVGVSPEGIAFNSISNRMYVINFGAGTVSVIDCVTNLVIGAPIVVGAAPEFIAFNSISNRMYVTNGGAGTVSVINCVTNLVIGAPIVVGVSPEGIAFNITSNTMYVTNTGAGTVSVINCVTNLVIGAPIVVGVIPIDIGYNSINNAMYVSNFGAGTVSVIDCATNTVVATIVVASPRGIAYNSLSNSLYIANNAPSTTSVISPIGGAIPAGVTINVLESTYQELLEETIFRPFIVGAMTISSTIPQLVQINTIRYRDTNGVIQQYIFHPFSYFSVNQYQNFLEIFPIAILINGEMQSQFNLLPNSTVTIVLYVKKRINMPNLLHDQPVEEVGSDLYPFFKSEIVV